MPSVTQSAVQERQESALHILWWGRSTLSYSRNEIIRRALLRQGCRLDYFRPKTSRTGKLEAFLYSLPQPDLLWVPCFRHRDMPSALFWAKRRKIPVIFDPLISAYDKQVYERKKFSSTTLRARRLFRWEKDILQKADLVIADTEEHALFFQDFFSVHSAKTAVIPVGANETLFTPQTVQKTKKDHTILFFGSFLGLQNPQIIIEAAHLCRNLPLRWKLVGAGPLLKECKQRAAGLKNIEFIPWVPYEKLPAIIHSADIVLGIFGTSAKAKRVIPNKVYQALACGKPLITMASPAFPPDFTQKRNLGIEWVDAGNGKQIAEAVIKLTSSPQILEEMGNSAYQTYKRYFSEADIEKRLAEAMKQVQP